MDPKRERETKMNTLDPKRKEMVAALEIGQAVCVVGKLYYHFCWGVVVEQHGPKGVKLEIEGGVIPFDEYGLELWSSDTGPWYIEEEKKALAKTRNPQGEKTLVRNFRRLPK
ncbi:MAG: hypothetical protein ABSD53_12990 [Terriglobales bacterium]|jgi:hypothetical protein